MMQMSQDRSVRRVRPDRATWLMCLVQWASTHGTTLHPDVEIYQDSTTGLSFRAVRDIPPNTKLVKCSYGVTLSYLNAVDALGFPRHGEAFPQSFLDSLGPEDPNIIGHFFLMQQYLLREKSFWWLYIRLLPQPDESISIPVWWPEEDRKWLNGTNAEPPLTKRTGMWKDEWERGIASLQEVENWREYSYTLYQWAASMFGSRSFRPSLTIPDALVPNYLEHVRTDKFSVLLPVVDIGNHNGVNNVDWMLDRAAGVFMLSNRSSLLRNSQIFNYYGNKSNSELLVAYGFTLPTTSELDKDAVNLKLKPPPEALALRRSQWSHVVPRVPDEEFMFTVQKRIDRDPQDGRILDFRTLSDGLIDLVLCMVANKREKRFLSRNPEYCPEKDPDIFDSALARGIMRALEILNTKLVLEMKRIEDSGADLGEPQNDNQRLALDYRNRQLSVLSAAIYPITNRLEAFFSFDTFCQQGRHVAPTAPGLQHFPHMQLHVELLSLECAFEWLRIHYSDIYSDVTKMISEDQDEPLPINWMILVEDWDHTYWVVWIFIVWMLWAQEGDAFRLSHKSLRSWLLDMNSAYDDETVFPGHEVLCCDASEKATIDLMVQGISQLPRFSKLGLGKWLEADSSVVTRLRDFASFVAQEETFVGHHKMGGGDQAGGIVEQKLLCIIKRKDRPNLEPSVGGWTEFLGRSPGFQKHSQ